MLVPPGDTNRSVIWLEFANRPDAELSAMALKHVEDWRALGIKMHAAAVSGPAFWQTAEIEEVPELLNATLAALEIRA